MQFLVEFEEYKPKPNIVHFWQNYVHDHYPVINSDGMKYIIIDEKPHYVTGPYVKKGWTIQKIYNDITHNYGGEIHEPSVRRGIKFWFDEQDYIDI